MFLDEDSHECECEKPTYEVVMYYVTGDSERNYDEQDTLPIVWKNKALARQAMNEIKELYRGRFLNPSKDVAPWMVFDKNGDMDGQKIQLELDDGTRKVIHAFWDADTFTHLKKMRLQKVEDSEEIEL